MASIISAGTTSGTALNMSGDTSGALQLATNGTTTAMTIDTSQNVGIGITPVSQNGKVLQIDGGATAADLRLTNTATGSAINNGILLGLAGSDAYLYNFENAFMAFGTNATERMRIDSSGNVIVNATAQVAQGKFGVAFVGSTHQAASFNETSGASSWSTVLFQRLGTTIGSISNATSSTAYNTSSDYRLKENIAPMTGALAKVTQLKPVTYKWKIDGADGEGFIAHELAEVCPHAVNGEKDAVDADGNPVYQGIDTSFLVATLTAAIQELKAINDTQAETITALTARIVALETV